MSRCPFSNFQSGLLSLEFCLWVVRMNLMSFSRDQSGKFLCECSQVQAFHPAALQLFCVNRGCCFSRQEHKLNVVCSPSRAQVDSGSRAVRKLVLMLFKLELNGQDRPLVFLRVVAGENMTQLVVATQPGFVQMLHIKKKTNIQRRPKSSFKKCRDGDLGRRTKMESVVKNADTFLR